MFDEQRFEMITQALSAFVNADRWDESKEIVERERHLLLTDEAELVLARFLAQYAGDAQATRLLEEHRVLLRRCREVGIEAAFADRVRPPTTQNQGIPPEFATDLQRAIAARDRLDMDNSRAAMDGSVAAWEAIFARPEITQYASFAIRVQV